jgi:hypothetical protein
MTQNVIETVIGTTQLEINVYDAAEPAEGMPSFSFQEPLVVEVSQDDLVSIKGIPVGMMNVAMLQPYMPIGLALNGADREVLISVNGTPMPYLYLAENGLPAVADTFLIEAIPWEKVEDMVENMELTLVLATDEAMASDINVDYSAATMAMPTMQFLPQVAVDAQGHVGVGVPPLRISSFIEAFGYPVEQVIWPYVMAYGDEGRTISLVVNSNAINVAISNITVGGIRWDNELRANVVDLVPTPALPFGLPERFPDWKSQLAEMMVQAQWGVEIAVVDEVPPSGFEPYLEDIGAVLPFLGF